MVRNSLQPHIHNVLCHPGGAIAIDLYFKHDYKFRIISVYLSSTDILIRNQTQNEVIKWIQQALSLNLNLIILGDFNASIQLEIPSSTKFKLISHLHNLNMYDLANYTNNFQHT